jgi:chorismate mutase
MEVLLAKEAEILMNEILGKLPHATLLLWIGSRNQNHPKQQAIGSAVAGEPRVKLMLKNQPWRDERHWKGMIGHVTHGGASEDQILLCHRGFAPWDKDSEQMRNIPDLAMAEKVQKDTGLPMIMDPSHIGGKASIVKELIQEFQDLPWVSGQLIEVHPDPEHARTDAKQQLTWEELGSILKEPV